MPPKYKIKQQVLNDFASTVEAKPDLTQQELLQKFPEFNNDPALLQSATDYYATSKSGKYKTVEELNSKFPEFEFDTTTAPTPAAPVKKNESSASLSPSTDGASSSASTVDNTHPPADATAIETKLPMLAPDLYQQVQKSKEEAAKGGKQAEDLSTSLIDVDNFAQRLAATYKDDNYYGIDGQVKTDFKDGDIVAVPKDKNLDGKTFPGGFAQLIDGKWMGTQAPDPNFVSGTDQPLPDVTVVGQAGNGFLSRNLNKPDSEITPEDYQTAIDQLFGRGDNLIKEATYANRDYEGSKKQPFFLLKNKEIIPVYEKTLQEHPSYIGSADGAYTALNNAVIKTYKLDESPWSGGGDKLVDSQQFNNNVQKAGQLKTLSDQLAETAQLYQSAAPGDKLALKQKYDGIAKQLSGIDTAALQAYFAQPEVKDIFTRTADQQKGYMVLSQMQKMFPQRGANEDAALRKRQEDATFMQGFLAPSKALFYGARSGVTDLVDFATEKIAALGGDKQARQQQRMNSETKQQMLADESLPMYDNTTADGDINNFLLGLSHMTGNIAPTLVTGGLGTTGAKVANALYFGATSAQQTLEQYRAQGVDNATAGKAALVNGGLMAVVGMGLPGGEGGALKGFAPSWSTVEKILNPELRAEGEQLLSREIIGWKGGELLKDLGGATKSAAEMKVVELVNAGVNTLVNNATGSQLNTDTGSFGDFVSSALSFAVQRQAMKGFNFRTYNDEQRAALVNYAAEGNIKAAVEGLQSLQQEPGADVAGIQRGIDDLHKFAGLQFPAEATPEQKTAVYLQTERKRILQDQQKQSPQFAASYEPEIKAIDKKIAELLVKPEVAAKDVEKITAPVQQEIQRSIAVLFPSVGKELPTITIGENENKTNENNSRPTPAKAGGSGSNVEDVQTEEQQGIGDALSQLSETGQIETSAYRIEKDGDTYRIFEGDGQHRLATREGVEEYIKSRQNETTNTAPAQPAEEIDTIPTAPTDTQAPAETESGDTPLQLTFDGKEPAGQFLDGLTYLADGSESKVYSDGKGNVIKIGEPHRGDTYAARVEHQLTLNEISDVPLEQLGYYNSTDSKGNVFKNPVFWQRQVEGRPATQEEIDNHFAEKGFVKIGRDSFESDGLRVSDVQPENVLVDKDGKVSIIDADVKKKEAARAVAKPLDTVELPNEGDGSGVAAATEPAPAADGVRKTILAGRAFDGAAQERVRAAIEKHGLFRPKISQQERSDSARQVISEVGEDAAFSAVKNNQIHGAEATAILGHIRRRLNGELSELEATDVDKIDDLAGQIARVDNELERVGFEGGSAVGQLAFEYGEEGTGYKTAAQKVKEFKDAGFAVTHEQEQRWKEIERQNSVLEKQLAEAEARASTAEDALVKAIKAADKRTTQRTFTDRAKETANVVRRLKTKALVFYDADGNEIQVQTAGVDFNGIIELAAKAIEKTGEIADGIKAALGKLSEAGWYNALTDRDREAVNDQLRSYLSSEPAETTDSGIRIPHNRIREVVQAGAKNINEVVEALRTDHPDATDREIRDAVTKYGHTVSPTKEQVEVDIRKMKRVGRLLSQLEDLQDKKRPLRSGLQRDKLDAEERALQKQVNDAMKDLPLDTELQDRQLRTALDAAKQRVNNQIEELQQAIDDNTKIVRNKGSVAVDAELSDLIARRDAVKQAYDQAFGETPLTEGEKKIRQLEKKLVDLVEGKPKPERAEPQYTQDEQDKIDALKEQIADERVMQGLVPVRRTEEEVKLAAIDRAIDKVNQQIADNNLQPNKPQGLSTPAIEARRAVLEATRKNLQDLREQAGIIEQQKLDGLKDRTEQGIAELERRIREKDFSDKPIRSTVEDSELIRLRAKKLALKEEYEKEKYKAELQNRSQAQKWKDRAWQLYGLTRSLRATGEMSFVLMQGGIQSLAHPTYAAKAFREGITAFKSKSRGEEWLREIKSQDWYPQAKKAKLALSEPNAKLSAAEELFYSNWTNGVWNMIGAPAKLISDKAYERWVAANPANALERTASVYLDSLRVQRYLDGVQVLEAKKATGEDIGEQDYADIADAVNTLTGRGSLGGWEDKSEALAKIFFSPRLWSSAMKTATPYGIYHFGKMTPTARKLAVADYSKFVGITTGLVAMAAARLNNDDDDTTSVELDPRSTDFGKIKIGNTRIDPWGGRLPLVVLQARMIMGGLRQEAIKDSSGELKKIGQDYQTPTMMGLLGQFATNKLAPSAAMLMKYLSTRENPDGELVDQYGKPYSFKSEITANLYPIYWDTIKEMLQDDKNGAVLNGLGLFYSFFGGGVSNYASNKKAQTLTQQREAAIEEVAAAARTSRTLPPELEEKMKTFNITDNEIDNKLNEPVLDAGQKRFKGLSVERKIDKWGTLTDQEKATLGQALSRTSLEDFAKKYTGTPELSSPADSQRITINPPETNTYDYFLSLYGNPKRAALEDMIWHAPDEKKKK